MPPLELLIPAAIFALVVVGGLVATAGGGQRAALKRRLTAIKTGAAPADTQPAKPDALAQALRALGAMPMLGGPSPKLRQTLVRAGYGQRHAAELFFGIKLVATALGIGAGAAAAVQMHAGLQMGLLLGVAGAAAGSMIPSFVLGQKVSKRTESIRQGLPNAIDLLEVCVTAGMGVDQAWLAASEEIREASPALADEMALVNFEMLLGAKRAEALKNMADRTGAEDIASLSSIITQADKFGTSMAEALRTFAETMREIRSQRAEESAEKMAIKLMLPMVIFIFPVVLLVSAGPAALKMMDLFAD